MTARSLSLSLQSSASLTSLYNEYYPRRRGPSTCSVTDRHTGSQDSTAIFSVNEPLIIGFYNLVTCLSGGLEVESADKGNTIPSVARERSEGVLVDAQCVLTGSVHCNL
jgi:hypothetical protein